MFPHKQNQINDTSQNVIGYPIIIDHELSEKYKSDSVSSQPNYYYPYPIIQQVQQPVYQQQQPPQQPYQQHNQQPFQQPQQQPCQQPYQQEYLQSPPLQQQPIYINPQYNQVVPNLQLINSQNNGMNQGQNKRFGLCITAIWAIQQLLEVLLTLYVLNYVSLEIPVQLCKLCVIFMFLIPIIVFQLKESRTTIVSFFLFLAFLLSSFGASIGFFSLIEILYGFYMVFQYFQFGTMISAFFYLLNTHGRPQANQLIKYTTVVLIINLAYFVTILKSFDFYVVMMMIMFNIMIWFFCCFLLSHMLVKTLQKIYHGQNIKIQRDNIWTGYILFKLYFFLPGV